MKFKKLLGLGLCLASVGTLAACSGPTIANSDNLSILKQEHADYKESNEALKLEVASLNTEVATMKSDLEAYKASDNAKAEIIAEKEALLAEKESELANKIALLAEKEAEIEELKNKVSSLSGSWSVEDNTGDILYGSYMNFYYLPDYVMFNYTDENNMTTGSSAYYQEVGSDVSFVDGNLEFYKQIMFYPSLFVGDGALGATYSREYKVMRLATGSYATEISKSNNYNFDKSHLSFEGITLDSELFPNKAITSVSGVRMQEIVRFNEDNTTSAWGFYVNYDDMSETFSLNELNNQISELDFGTYYISFEVSVEIFDGIAHNHYMEQVYVPVNIVE